MKTIRIELCENFLWATLILSVAAVLALVSFHHTERFNAAIAAGYSETTVPGRNEAVWVKTK